MTEWDKATYRETWENRMPEDLRAEYHKYLRLIDSSRDGVPNIEDAQDKVAIIQDIAVNRHISERVCK